MESTTLAQLHEEVKSLKGEISRLRALVNNEQKKKKREEEERTKMAEEALVSKVDAADILMVSPRHLRRIRHKIGLRWKRMAATPIIIWRVFSTPYGLTNCLVTAESSRK